MANQELVAGISQERHAISSIFERPTQHPHRNPAKSVAALNKALAILQMLGNSRAGLALPEIVQALRFPESSVHCILVPLEQQKCLYRSESTERYYARPEVLLSREYCPRATADQKICSSASPVFAASYYHLKARRLKP